MSEPLPSALDTVGGRRTRLSHIGRGTQPGIGAMTFEAAYERWRPDVARYIAKRTGGHDVEDLTQETFLRAWQHAGGCRAPSWSWLQAIAHSAVVDYLRARYGTGQSRRPVLLSLTGMETDLDEWLPDARAADPEAVAVQRERVRQAARLFPPRQFSLLLLHAHGMSDVEIGQLAGLAPSSVTSMRSVARSRAQRQTEDTRAAAGQGYEWD